MITHGHSDHAREGHGTVLATPETLAIMVERYGAEHAVQTQAAPYGEAVHRDAVEVTLVPAGHVLGSAQAVVRWRGMTIVVSGDYKRRRDPTCPPFEPVVEPDVFVTEATFGLPVFRHPDSAHEVDKLLRSLRQFPERTHMVGVYALGKAQRVIRLLREAGYEKPIYVHGAMNRLNALYGRHGIDLGPLEPATTDKKTDFAGEIVLGPPSALQDRWGRRFPDPVISFASGWMNIRARARQRAVELPLVISDHADWDELTATIAEVNPGELWITHGEEEGLERWCQLHGRQARPLRLVGYEDDDD